MIYLIYLVCPSGVNDFKYRQLSALSTTESVDDQLCKLRDASVPNRSIMSFASYVMLRFFWPRQSHMPKRT